MSRPSYELDVRSMTSDDAYTRLVRAFDALESDCEFLLIDDDHPRGLLTDLAAERPGRCDWLAVELGPARFRFQVRRRAIEGPCSVGDYLSDANRRLDAVLRDIRQLVDSGRLADAAARYTEFSCALERHFEAEERVLFPRFERLSGYPFDATKALRRQHEQIRQLMACVTMTLDAAEPLTAQPALQGLGELLADHYGAEERAVYDPIDRALNAAAERRDLALHLQAY